MLALAVTNSSVNTGNKIRGDDQLCTAKAYLLACEVLLENCLYIAYASIRLRLAYPNSTGTFENVLSKLGPKPGCRDPAALPCSPDAVSRMV